MIRLGTPPDAQPPPEHAGDAGLAFLAGLVAGEGRQSARPAPAARDALLAKAAAWRPWQRNPVDLVGRPCPLSPPDWHLRRLLALAAGTSGPADREVDRARRLYHARWLGHLLAPREAAFRPVVTVLIPAYNRSTMAVEAVRSCLAQTWRPLEILVVDDGSTDDLARALAPFGNAITLRRQPNRGVSSARNAGIRLARGDFVHFLDSDNLLLPAAVARKVDAFARFADAELCYSLAEVEGEHHPDLPRIPPPDGSPLCPTTSLLNYDLRYPFYVSCVMLPRFTLLDAGGFEEDLRRGEDTRFWITLGLRDTKVVGLGANLTVRRTSRSSLSARPMTRSLQFVIRARTIADLLGDRRAWPLAARSFPGLLHIVLMPDDALTPELLESGMLTLLDAIAALGSDQRRDASPLPLLAHLRHLTLRVLGSNRGIDGTRSALLGRLHAALEAAAATCAPLTRQDLLFWSDAEAVRNGKVRLNSFCACVAALSQRDAFALSAADELLRRTSLVPTKRAIRAYRRLRRRAVPKSIAGWFARRKIS